MFFARCQSNYNADQVFAYIYSIYLYSTPPLVLARLVMETIKVHGLIDYYHQKL